MSTAELQNADTLFVNAEKEALGKLDDYVFESQELKEIASTYFTALDLQTEGIKYANNYDEISAYEQTWKLGRAYRISCIQKLSTGYGLTVNSKYQSYIDEMLAETDAANKTIAIQEYVNYLTENLRYDYNGEKSDEYFYYYTTIIENTSGYTIDSLDIEVDFVNEDGVVIDQTSDYLQNLAPGSKVQSELMYDLDYGNFAHMQFHISAYTD